MGERNLLKQSNAYKIISADMASKKLSHAYLIVSQDESLLRLNLKFLASLIQSKTQDDRVDKLILKETFSDCLIFPEIGKNIVVATVEEIALLTLNKPIESDCKIFILTDCQNMNAQSQNKLLKTLEEPPKNVILLLGTTKKQSMLSTVISRTKVLEILPFSEKDILKVLNSKFKDLENAEIIASSSGGILGLAIEMASGKQFEKTLNVCFNAVESLKSVTDILAVSEMFLEESKNIKQLLSLFKVVFRDMLFQKCGQSRLIINKPQLISITKWAGLYDIGALIWAVDKINQAEQDITYNANINMLVERLLLSIMEGKHKWQKL